MSNELTKTTYSLIYHDGCHVEEYDSYDNLKDAMKAYQESIKEGPSMPEEEGIELCQITTDADGGEEMESLEWHAWEED